VAEVSALEIVALAWLCLIS